MTREQKLALIVGFSLILLVGVLISDHLSRARAVQVAGVEADEREIAAESRPNLPEVIHTGATEKPHDAALAPEPVVMPTGATNPPAAGHADEPSSGTTIAMGPATAGQSARNPQVQPAVTLTDATKQLIEEMRDGAKTALHDGMADVRIPPATSLEHAGKAGQPQVEPVPTAAADPAPAKPATTWYTVKPGETLFQIAKRQYGKGSEWKRLADLNKGRVGPDGGVRAGTQIELLESVPGATEAPAKAANPAAGPGSSPSTKPADKPAPRPVPTEQRITKNDSKSRATARTYTVQKGDSIGVISQKVLGTSKRKDEIMDLNKGVVDDEDSIQVGMILKMPAR